MNQHSTADTAANGLSKPGRFRQILPLMAAMIPVVCGLGFHVVGPRPQLLQTDTLRPPLAFHQYMVNLGEVPVQRSHAATFSFTNRGDQAMKLRRLETSCGCLTQQFEQEIANPGENGRFRLWIQTASQSPGIKQYTCKAIYGPVDDPDIEYKADLVFRITLPEQSVLVTPKAVIFYQPNDRVTERTVDVTDLRFKRLRVLEATCQSQLLGVSVLPVSDLTTTERDEGVVGRINVRVGAVPPGTHNAVIQIRTDDEEFDQLVVPVLIHGPEASSDAGADHTDQTATRSLDEPIFDN